MQKKSLLMWWGVSGWRKNEAGYFFLDILGGVFMVMVIVTGLAYVNMQLSHMSDLEADVTAADMVKDQLDRLCIEQEPGDLGTKTVSANGHEYQIASSMTQGEKPELVRYKVVAEWQGRKRTQQFMLEKEVCREEI